METRESLNLTRKYRPKKMSEYVGNDKLKTTILSWLARGSRPQAILLKGSTGGGKTTMSRLIAKEYLCENRDVETGACGVCPNCESIDSYIETGESEDLPTLKEINASKDSGLAVINSLLEDANYASFDGSWKIYILDECHRISKPAQNSLLKLVEEPPEKVLFMFCTTDPDQMLETLLNRCNIKADVKKPSERELAGLLANISDLEGVEHDRRGISLLVDRSELVIRQALMDLENVIVQRGAVTIEEVLQVYDEKPNALYFDFFQCLLDKDTYRYVSVLHKIKTTMPLTEFIRNLTNFTKRGVYILHGADLEGITKNEIKNMKELFTRFTLEEIGQLLQFLLRVYDGDVETNLLSLGFRGLTPTPHYDGQREDIIKDEPNAIQKEDKVKQVNGKEYQQEQQHRSIETAKEATKEMSEEDIFDFFN